MVLYDLLPLNSTVVVQIISCFYVGKYIWSCDVMSVMFHRLNKRVLDHIKSLVYDHLINPWSMITWSMHGLWSLVQSLVYYDPLVYYDHLIKARSMITWSILGLWSLDQSLVYDHLINAWSLITDIQMWITWQASPPISPAQSIVEMTSRLSFL